MRTFERYLLIQLPGWIVAGALLTGAWMGGWIGGALAVGLFLGWVGKDVLLYPLLKRSYEARVPTGPERLVGRLLRARTPLAPRGYVVADGELWRAELVPGSPPVSDGATVLVRHHRGLTLLVERAPDPPAAAEPPAAPR